MRTVEYPDFPEDDRSDFERACRKHGLKAEDFAVLSAADYQGEGLIKVIVGKVSVSRGKEVRYYPAGHGLPSWTIPFEDDLKKGVFG